MTVKTLGGSKPYYELGSYHRPIDPPPPSDPERFTCDAE
jgi:hypothetical protein